MKVLVLQLKKEKQPCCWFDESFITGADDQSSYILLRQNLSQNKALPFSSILWIPMDKESSEEKFKVRRAWFMTFSENHIHDIKQGEIASAAMEAMQDP